MGFLNILLMVVAVLLIVEAVIEFRRKRWLAFALSLCFIALVVYINLPAYRYLAKKVIPPATAPASP